MLLGHPPVGVARFWRVVVPSVIRIQRHVFWARDFLMGLVPCPSPSSPAPPLSLRVQTTLVGQLCTARTGAPGCHPRLALGDEVLLDFSSTEACLETAPPLSLPCERTCLLASLPCERTSLLLPLPYERTCLLALLPCERTSLLTVVW